MNKVPMTQLIRIPSHEPIRTLLENKQLREQVEQLELGTTEFLRVDIGDGVELDGWCITPPDLDSTKRYSPLVYVYSEPAGTTVVDRWGGSRYLWHQMLVQQGCRLHPLNGIDMLVIEADRELTSRVETE